MRFVLAIYAMCSLSLFASAEEPAELKLVKSLTECWDGVLDLPSPDRLQVTLKVWLDDDGSIAQNPEVITPESISLTDKDMLIALVRANHAVHNCQPFVTEGLPRSQNGKLEPVVINFHQTSDQTSS